MKNKIYLMIFLIFCISDNAKSYYEYWLREDWELLPEMYVVGKLTNLRYDFFFVDSLTVLLNDGSTVAGPEIYKSIDGGYTWSCVLRDGIRWKDGKHEYVPAQSTSLSAKNSIAVLGTVNETISYFKTYSKDSGMVWISLDTGKTWKKNFTGLRTGILDVKILDDGTIVVLSHSFIAKSEDTGKTWQQSSQFPYTINDTTRRVHPIDSTKNIETYWWPNFIECHDKQNIYVCSIHIEFPSLKSKMIFTSDGGKSWKSKELPDKKRIYGLCTTPDKKIWITGTYRRNDTGRSYTYIDYSTDNGDTWKHSLDTIFSERPPDNTPTPRRIKFYDSLNGAMVGFYGTFVRTTDGGKTWHDEIRKGVKPDTMIYGNFYNLDYRTKNTIALYIGGYTMESSLVIAPLLSIPSGLKNDEISKSNNYIFPNPATDFITIHYDYEGNGASSTALIYDILGVKVAQEPLINGNNKINISHLTPGVYFIKIGDRVEKFIKI